MRKIALLSCLVLASAAFASAAAAKHHNHHRVQAHAESLTTVGTPDCHLQGRLLRVAHHCPPEAVTAAPR
jgi:hypothetical protein